MADEAKLDDLGFEEGTPEVVVKDLGAAVPPSDPPQEEPPPEAPAEPPAEAPAESEPESPAEEPGEAPAEPVETPAPAPAEPGETVEQLQARLASLEQERQAERQGFIRQLSNMRSRPREMPQQGQQPETPPVPDKVPVHFDDNGQPFVKPEDLQKLQAPQQQVTPEMAQMHFAQAHEQMRNRILLEKPVEYAEPIRELVGAYQDLDARLAAKQAETGSMPLQSVDEVMHFARMTGVLDGWRAAHPGVAPTDYDVVDLIAAGASTQETPMRRVLDGYLSRKGAAAMAERGGVANGNGAPAQPSTPPKQLPAEKPRSMAERGRSETVTEEASDLPEDFMDWSDADFEKFKKGLPVKVTGSPK